MNMLSRRVLSRQAMESIHNKALDILEQVGMRIMYEGYFPALQAKGASVDLESHVVKFPRSFVEATILGVKTQIQNGDKQFLLNGVTSPHTEDDAIRLKFAGATIEFLDPLTNKVREPEENDLIRLIALGESIPEVKYVGNPVCYLRDSSGNKIPGPVQRIKTAAVVAKYTTKYGSNEVWNEKELDLLIELGTIVKGGREQFFKNPCFVTAKETIAPLLFPREDGRILYMLAEKNLPCTIIPMPLSGASSPVTIPANIAMTLAEVLGAMTCLRASFPKAMVGGGVLSGVMDMRRGVASFAAPETLLQDLGAANIFADLYGQNFAIGTGYIDAVLPGAQSAVEILARIAASHSIGHCYYPVGLLFGGKRWSPVQAYIGLEMAKYVHRCGMEITVNDEDIPMDVIKAAGISGTFLDTDHTLENFRQNIWMTDLMERSLIEKDTDVMIDNATQKWTEFLKKEIRPAVSDEQLKEIDKWEKKAIEILMK
jgi:trimethylamine--corrinoid protein Co-methyltransferase